ncbi:MAG: DinB family protein [Candidatus Pacebacteria bacterium]|nr:DinB family protein [Candidatus Paceibacterota bacterium]MDD5357078.1 DinB family protein [Candidatus Paceibacterota bacterium]
MNTNTFAQEFLRELKTEIAASRKCIERIPESVFNYKPHEKSMAMGYLTVIVAEVPRWIAITIEKGEIDFATWEKYKLTTNAELVKYFDKNVEWAENALKNTTDEALEEMFYLKMGGKELMKSLKKESVSSQINHWIHHRGQLTVYMRLNNIPVPSIYGPSADENTFK